ncbi:MAG: Rpn family recombination-promoting nuclease/putative transposase [Bacteroidales bacterium]|nr:Rpn family recombination-promoting nuclease/putative transposase [Bacteroidales bacterium]
MHYYDPKTDIVFKKIFGEHKNLTISLLNAVLKLEGDDQISDVEYLPSEIIPLTDGKRRSVVDVKCKVSDQIYFIVEMQMYWSADFLRRVMYNCSKLYATLYNEGVRYYKMKKIFAINILNDVYQTKNTNNYHRYTMSEVDNPESVIPGFEVVCIELPKFKPQDKAQGKMLRLWQSFLTSVNAGVDAESIPQELMENSETKQALELCQNLTEEERRAYDSFWDLESLNIDRENTVKEMGRAEGRAEGAKQKATETARQMKTDGLTVEVISKYTGLVPDEIAKL